ncbi:hypothetical protein BDV59DRAFT_202776 [Aspergillus ambiguus]|uniref:uncharacterized protein n=1 Tax=Aspergillus ambiguus TaxID=176160 RepID=UPI003CCC8F60
MLDVHQSLQQNSHRGHDWNEDVSLSESDLQTTNPYITVWLVCEFLALLALIVFFIGTFLIQQPKDPAKTLPIKTVWGSILSYIISRILSIAVLFLYVLNKTVQLNYVAINMLEIIFYLLAWVLLFSVFYRVTHRHLESFSEGEPFPRVILAHWTILGVLSALAIANCATRIASLALAVNQSVSAEAVYQQDSRLSTARAAIFMLISLEILAWTIFILRKSQSKTGTVALLVGILMCFAQNLTATITIIQTSLVDRPLPPYVNAVATLIEFFCILGIYTGIIICSLQWQKSDDNTETAVQPPPSRSSFPSTLKGKEPSRPQYQPYRPSMSEVLAQQQRPQHQGQSSQGFPPRYYMVSGRSTFDQREARMSGGSYGASD